MTTYVNFSPTPSQAFQFQLTLDGQAYLAIITWNIFGRRWYFNLYTLQQVLLAIPNPPPELVQRVLHTCEEAGLTMKVLPVVSDLVDGTSHMASLRQAREPRIEDLLGRTPVPIDLDTVRRSLAGRRVLVTPSRIPRPTRTTTPTPIHAGGICIR